MRKSVLIASVLVVMSQGYRAARGDSPTAKSILSWCMILVTLSFLGLSPLASFADIFAYIIIAIIVLNDGYDMINQF